MAAYTDRLYAESLSEFGSVVELRGCGGWILQRQIGQSPYYDAMGCYPLFACHDWSRIPLDLAELEDAGLVSLSLVADPFGNHDMQILNDNFDRVIPFKEHFVVDLALPLDEVVSKHHRYYVRKALSQNVRVEACPEPIRFLDEWVELYSTLAERHNLKGLKAFSRRAFEKQLSTPGMVALRATADGTTIGGHLWYIQEDVAYSHLAAASPLGYELMVSYALYDFAIRYFAGAKLSWLNIGAGAGTSSDSNDGLTQFKRGWATGTRTAYFCGRVFNREAYAELVRQTGTFDTSYFPAYRQGELA